MFACRLCRIPLSAAEGCAVCNPVRRNLVVVGEREEDRPSLSGVGAEVVSLLREQLARVKKLLKDAPDSEKAGKRLIALANSTAKVIGEVRKLQEDGAAAVENMAFAERAEMFIDWVTGLPPAYRRSLVERLAEYEAKIAAPVPEEALA
jgi:hypothetical protein